jgi:hypothetical protein
VNDRDPTVATTSLGEGCRGDCADVEQAVSATADAATKIRRCIKLIVREPPG